MKKKLETTLIRSNPQTHALAVAYCKSNCMYVGRWVDKLIEREIPQAFKDQFNASQTPNQQA